MSFTNRGYMQRTFTLTVTETSSHEAERRGKRSHKSRMLRDGQDEAENQAARLPELWGAFCKAISMALLSTTDTPGIIREIEPRVLAEIAKAHLYQARKTMMA